MIGQKKIQDELFSYSLKTFPKSILLLGDYGSGKHLIANKLSYKFNIPLIDITNNLDTIDEIQSNTTQAFYLVDLTSITEKQQNILLKTLEDTNDYVYMILLSTTKNIVLPTILNRCITYTFETYSKDELLEYINQKGLKPNLLNYCSTIGQIKNAANYNIEEVKTLCEKIADKIDKATYQNTLSIANKINYKDEYDKVDYITFLRILLKTLLDKYKEKCNTLYVEYYKIVDETLNNIVIDKRLNMKSMIEQCLTKIWRTARK